MKKIYLAIIILFLAAVGVFVLRYSGPSSQSQIVSVPTAAPVQQKRETFAYKGETGKNALALLEAKATTSLDKSGMVASINGRTAESSKKEYWAFYVNGAMAQVGPKEYVTKNTDTIEWKIATY